MRVTTRTCALASTWRASLQQQRRRARHHKRPATPAAASRPPGASVARCLASTASERACGVGCSSRWCCEKHSGVHCIDSLSPGAGGCGGGSARPGAGSAPSSSLLGGGAAPLRTQACTPNRILQRTIAPHRGAVTAASAGGMRKCSSPRPADARAPGRGAGKAAGVVCRLRAGADTWRRSATAWDGPGAVVAASGRRAHPNERVERGIVLLGPVRQRVRGQDDLRAHRGVEQAATAAAGVAPRARAAGGTPRRARIPPGAC